MNLKKILLFLSIMHLLPSCGGESSDNITSNYSPEFKKVIFSVPENTISTIDLSKFIIDPESQELTFSISAIDSFLSPIMTLESDGKTLKINAPDVSSTTIGKVLIVANDSINEVSENILISVIDNSIDSPLEIGQIVGPSNGTQSGSAATFTQTANDNDVAIGGLTINYSVYGSRNLPITSGFFIFDAANSNYKLVLDTSGYFAGDYKIDSITSGGIIGGANPDSYDKVSNPFIFVIVASSPIIDIIPDQTVNDNGGLFSTALSTVTGQDFQTGAVFSLFNDPTGGRLTISSTTGELIWNGDINQNETYLIFIKIINPDTGSDIELFFLDVADNA